MRIPELLAPAGSVEAFLAAMKAGADACYTNFPLKYRGPRVCAHTRGVTMNAL